MRVLLGIVAALAGIFGLLLVLGGLAAPAGYNLTLASAPQIAEVYSQATYTLAEGIAGLVVAALCAAWAAALPARSVALAVRAAGACPRCTAGVFAGQRYCGNCALGLDPVSIAAWQAAQMMPPQPVPAAPAR